MPLNPGQYATLLGDKIDRHNSDVWLVNTGWTGGPYGVGNRLPLAHTRRMVTAVLSGELADCDLIEDPVFGLQAPAEIEGVPQGVLRPRDTWQDSDAYDTQARMLARMFQETFKQFENSLPPEIAEAGPRI
jgi:phosphoenolpyruvate carboxykinase (ATP)